MGELFNKFFIGLLLVVTIERHDSDACCCGCCRRWSPGRPGTARIQVTEVTEVDKSSLDLQYALQRRRRDADRSSCKCSDSLDFELFNITALKMLDMAEVKVTITKYVDQDGRPVFDSLTFVIHRRGSNGLAVRKEEVRLVTDTRTCDCTSVVTVGNYTITGEEKDGKIVHGHMMKGVVVVEESLKGLKVEVVAVIVIACLLFVIVVASVVIYRRKKCRKEIVDAPSTPGVENRAYIVDKELDGKQG